MQRDETKSKDCGETARVICIAELVKTGAGALIATGTTPAWAKTQTGQERSGVRAAPVCE